jgi:hypothetical protein
VRDAERFRDILVDPDFCGFDEVTLLANEDTATAKRTLERCVRVSEPGDLILFYYNGHGRLDRDGTLALAMPATDSEILRASSLLADEIKGLFNLSRASQRIMILDCCYSGAVDSHGFKGTVTDSITSLAQQFTGSFLLTASRRFERAWELDEQQAGALTEALVDGVRSGAAAPAASDHITLGQLAAYVRQSVPASSPQQPEYWDNGGIGEIFFAKKARRLDSAWAAGARRMVTNYVAKSILDEELAEELREVIGATDRERHADRLRLIDRLAAKEIQVSAFVGAWARVKDAQASPPPAPPRSPSSRREGQIAPPEPLSPPLAEKSHSGPTPPGGPMPPPISQSAPTGASFVGIIIFVSAITLLLFGMFNLINERTQPASNTVADFGVDSTENSVTEINGADLTGDTNTAMDSNALSEPSVNNIESNTTGM